MSDPIEIKRREMKGGSTLVERLYRSRNEERMDAPKLSQLLHPNGLSSIEKAAKIIGDAILAQKTITISGDYDCDGATGTAVAYRGLRLLGATDVHFILPNRFTHGYGLSPALVDDMSPKPDLIVTVDSGTSSHAGVDRANELGIAVVVTDHHLQGETLPDAAAIVNPNLNADTFESKALAGVGVMFYVLMMTRRYLADHAKDHGMTYKEPDLTTLLDLVALGSVADLVPLDRNNRALVSAGLRRIRNGLGSAGINAILTLAGKDPAKCTAQDFGFAIGPRLNAAGRMDDMTVGVQCLITDSQAEADLLAKQLDEINKDRKEKQADMVTMAEGMIVDMAVGDNVSGVTVFDPSWHAGIVGLVASKIKDATWRPTFALAPAEEGSTDVRGSGRSIEGFHLRDALALVDVKAPGILKKFGGHAMAAGVSIHLDDVDTFKATFDAVCKEMLSEEALTRSIVTDGSLLEIDGLNLETVREVEQAGPWGQGFPYPVFDDVFHVASWKVLGAGHLKLEVQKEGDMRKYDAMFFSGYEGKPVPKKVRMAYEVQENVWRERSSLQLMVRTMSPA